MRIVRFFTTPPRPYPYVLVNVRRPILTYVRFADEVIIDSGIEIFRDPNVKDYPKDHIMNILKVFAKVRSLVGSKQVYVTVPDYCDDYNPKALWLNENYTNIERTVDNVLKYTEQYKWIPWLIPIQGWNKNPGSVLRCINLYKEYGIIDKFNYFAIGNLCVEPNTEIIYKTCKIVRSVLKDKKIHVFGLKLSALKYVYHMIDSFDSMAWTRPIDKEGHSCKTTQERIEYFEKWLKRYEKIVNKLRSNTSTLEKFINKSK